MTVEADHGIRGGPLDEPPLPAAKAPIEMAGDAHDRDDHVHGFEWWEAARIAFVAVAAVAVWCDVWEPIKRVSLLGVIGLLVGGWPIFKEALENILARRMTMEPKRPTTTCPTSMRRTQASRPLSPSMKRS